MPRKDEVDPTEAAEAAGAQYAQDQFESDYFRDWIHEQILEGEELRRQDPGSVIDDPKQIARNLLQQLKWDIHRMDRAELKRALSAVDVGDADVSERELQKAFFDGLDAELEKPETRAWLAQLVGEQMAEVCGTEVGEARRSVRAQADAWNEDMRLSIGTVAHNRGTFTSREIAEYLAGRGGTLRPVSTTTVRAQLQKLVRAGYLSMSGRGEYSVTKLGWDWIEGGVSADARGRLRESGEWGIWDASRKKWMINPLRGQVDQRPARYPTREEAERVADREWRKLNPDTRFETRPLPTADPRTWAEPRKRRAREAGPPPGYDQPAPKWAAKVVIVEGDGRRPWTAKVYDARGSVRSGVNDRDREYVEQWVAMYFPGVPVERRKPEPPAPEPRRRSRRR